jgi:hypothetical protein
VRLGIAHVMDDIFMESVRSVWRRSLHRQTKLQPRLILYLSTSSSSPNHESRFLEAERGIEILSGVWIAAIHGHQQMWKWHSEPRFPSNCSAALRAPRWR